MADDVVIVQPITTSVTVTPIIPNITVTAPGPQGPQGPAGSGGSFYVHTQNTPASAWVIIHNLNGNPTAVVFDSGGSQCEGTFSYQSLNQMTITFTSAFAGIAYII